MSTRTTHLLDQAPLVAREMPAWLASLTPADAVRVFPAALVERYAAEPDDWSVGLLRDCLLVVRDRLRAAIGATEAVAAADLRRACDDALDPDRRALAPPDSASGVGAEEALAWFDDGMKWALGVWIGQAMPEAGDEVEFEGDGRSLVALGLVVRRLGHRAAMRFDEREAVLVVRRMARGRAHVAARRWAGAAQAGEDAS